VVFSSLWVWIQSGTYIIGFTGSQMFRLQSLGFHSSQKYLNHLFIINKMVLFLWRAMNNKIGFKKFGSKVKKSILGLCTRQCSAISEKTSNFILNHNSFILKV
jgi:hypothetical protein